MADIDEIISGVRGNTKADFSGLFSGPIDAYNAEKDQRAKNDLRDAFKDGLPMKDGQPDWSAVTQTFFKKGSPEQGIAAANLALAQQKVQYGQNAGNEAYPSGAPQQPIVGPSTSRNSVAIDATKRADSATTPQPQAPQGQQQPTVMTILAAQNFPNDQLGAASASIARQLGVNPTDPIDPTDPQIRNVLVPAVQQLKRMGIGQVQPPQPGDNPPQVAQGPQAPPPPPDFNSRFNAARPGQGSDPTLGGLVPPGRTPAQQMDLLSRQITSGNLTPEQAKLNLARIEAIKSAIEPTGPMKEYDKAVSQGFKGTLEDWQNRTDDNTTQRDILTKSLIPRIEKSQEKAVSSVEDIDAIHRSRTELDQRGGVFSGKWADMRLQAVKIGNLLGIADADKITNTESYSAAIGKRVAAMVKAFGSGTAISDGDRRFAEKMAGGNIELNETAMRRILDIGEKADRAIIDRHNGFADTIVRANDGLKSARNTFIVQHPAQYQKPDTSNAVYDAARAAIDKGAPRDGVMKRLKENGYDPAKL